MTGRAHGLSILPAVSSTPAVPDPSVQPVMTVEDAGRCCGLGRSAAYDAARRGELPTISFGRRRVVPTAALRKLLALDDP